MAREVPTVLSVDVNVHPVSDLDVDLCRAVVIVLAVVTLTSPTRLTLTLTSVTFILHLAHERICNEVIVV